MDWFLFLLHVKTFRYVMAVKCYTLVLNSYACSQSTSKICNIITFITRICSAFVLHFKVPLEMMWVGSMILALFAGIFNTFVYNSDKALTFRLLLYNYIVHKWWRIPSWIISLWILRVSLSTVKESHWSQKYFIPSWTLCLWVLSGPGSE